MATPLLQSRQTLEFSKGSSKDENPMGWQQEMKAAFRSATELCRFLEIDPATTGISDQAAAQFPLFVPRCFARRMARGDPDDPLLRQVLNVNQEEVTTPAFTLDPVGEANAVLTPGILQKYQGRALLIATGVCPVHCRYCFRRHFPYEQAPHGPEQWKPSLTAIHADDSIHEVLLSGGDPLVLSDRRLSELIGLLEEIPHLKRLRIHTRTPIIIPARVTERLLDRLSHSHLATWVVVHTNHPNELDQQVLKGLGKIVAAGIPVLNQTVLLRGINDSAEVLAGLFEKLIDARILPYYLHQLDRVAGTAHFEVPIEIGKRLITELRARLPGYAVPRYVQELPNEFAKTILA